MKYQLKSLVENLKNYSKKLDNYAILTEQPWITKTENEEERFVVIFRKKDNELLISVNGKVEKGKWDYIPAMNSLIVERESGTTLYNQGFFDDSIMILKVDGTDNYQLFVNENKIESSIEKLLEKIEKKYLQGEEDKNVHLSDKKILCKKLPDGRSFEIHRSLPYGYTVGDRVTINGEYPQDGKYRFNWATTIVVSDGIIKKL